MYHPFVIPSLLETLRLGTWTQNRDLRNAKCNCQVKVPQEGEIICTRYEYIETFATVGRDLLNTFEMLVHGSVDQLGVQRDVVP